MCPKGFEREEDVTTIRGVFNNADHERLVTVGIALLAVNAQIRNARAASSRL